MNFTLLASLAGQHSWWLYPVLFFVACFEGPMVMMFSGFLVRVGVFNPAMIYPVLLLGDWLGDFLWYAVGYFGAQKTIAKVGRFFSVDMDVIPKIEHLFEHHQKKIIFISKITMGFGFALATLMSAGMAKVSLKNFGFYNLLGGFVWTGTLMLIGFSLGQAYLTVGKGFDILSLVAGSVAFILVLFGFGNYMRKRFINTN